MTLFLISLACASKINNPTFDVVNVNQDFSLKYSNNKMDINDVINKLSINNTRANLLTLGSIAV
jgi:hypothetical protein